MNAQREKFLLYRIRILKDEQAFKAIFDDHVSAVRRFLLTRLPSKEDADDALTQTFMRVWNYVTKSEVEALSGLIFTIARGVVSEFYRTKGDTVVLSTEQVSEEALVDEGKEKDIRLKTDIMIIKRRLSELSDSHQLAITLKYFENLSTREIAKRLQKTENATRVLIHRAIKALNELLT